MSILRRLLANWLPAYAFLYIAFLYLPVLLLPVFSVNTSASPRFPLSGLTLQMVRATCRRRRRCSTPPGTA